MPPPNHPITTDLKPAPGVAIWANPIVQRCRRARLRPHHLLTYGILGLSVITFVFLSTYLGAIGRFEATPQVAAKATLLPLLIMQGIALMGLGTAALASGIARERDRALLDYQRMTPMSPTAKIVGYLFGLPSREYLLFALTLPYLAFALYQAEIPIWKIAKYYGVFFSSVWVYHLTGLCAGIVSKKPWQASVISLGSVVGLYLVLPQLSFAGLAFFDFLTVRPTFFNVIAEELNQQDRPWNAEQWMTQYGAVPFFTANINPTVFSLAIQGFALASLFTVIHRKWVDPHRHPFSKPQGLAFQVGIVVVLVGTLWPTLSDPQQVQALQRRLGALTPSNVMGWLLGLYIVVAGLTTLGVAHLLTPRQPTARQGFRRALRQGRRDIPAIWDAAPALRWVAALFTVTLLGYVALLTVVIPNFVHTDETWASIPWLWFAAPMLILGPACFFVHALAERYSVRVMLLVLFGLWVIPMMVSVVFYIAAPTRSNDTPSEFTGGSNEKVVAPGKSNLVPALWIASPSPVIPGTLALLTLTQETGEPIQDWQSLLRDPLRKQVPWMIAAHVILYAGLGLWLQLRRRAWAKRWHAQERALFEAIPHEPPTLGRPPQPSNPPQSSPGSVEPGNESVEPSRHPTG
ncbi:MAG: hypothetical protein AAF328_06790 [Planctomycetota bacterium]